MDIGNVKYWKHPSKTKFVFIENDSFQLISVDIWVKAGKSFERCREDGLAHFLEHMIFKGNNLLSQGEFDLRIETLGGLSNASTGYDDVHYYIEIPKKNFKEAISLLFNLVFLPKFDYEQFNLEKSVITEEILQFKDQPEERVFNYFLSRIWLNHFYGKSILGSEENIEKLSVKDIENFHNRLYKGSNICVAIAGDLPKNYLEILKNQQIYFSKNESLSPKTIRKKDFSINSTKEIVLFEKIEFSRIYMGWQLPSSKNQRLILGFEILASILTDGRSSVLTKLLKEKNYLVESVYSDVSLGEFGSLFLIEASCLNENILEVEKIINNVIKNLINCEKINNNDLKKAIRIVKSSYIFNLETVSQLTSYFGNHLLWGRQNPHEELERSFEYWSNSNNFKNLIKFLAKEKYTLIAKRK